MNQPWQHAEVLLSIVCNSCIVSYHVMYSVYDQYMKYGVFRHCLFFYQISAPAINYTPTVVSVCVWMCLL